jgi:hypothetical protein
VRISGLPAGGSFVIDGRSYSATATLPPGPHAVEVRAPGYVSYSTAVHVTVGEEVVLAFAGVPVRREPATATLAVRVEAGSRLTWAAVSIGGTTLGSRLRDTSITVRAGTPVRIRAERRGFATIDTTVAVQPGRTLQLVLELEREQ